MVSPIRLVDGHGGVHPKTPCIDAELRSFGKDQGRGREGGENGPADRSGDLLVHIVAHDESTQCERTIAMRRALGYRSDGCLNPAESLGVIPKSDQRGMRWP